MSKLRRNHNIPFYLVILFIAWLLSVSLSSCSCNWYLDKARQKCGKTSFTDTLTVRDTIVIKSVSKDTVFKYTSKDTVVIKEGRMTVKYFHNTKDSVVYLHGNCASDTVYKEIKVPYTSTTLEFSISDWLRKWMWVIIIFVLVFVSLVFVIKKFILGK